MTWQPIETAPKDGTEILGFHFWEYGFGKPSVCGPWTMAFLRKNWMASWGGQPVIEYMSDFGTTYKETEMMPTHWMPLPDAPDAAPQEK
jgi:hypothetical protein